MKLALFAILAFPVLGFADVTAVPASKSSDGKLHAVLDIDRDPTITLEGKGDSFPHQRASRVSAF